MVSVTEMRTHNSSLKTTLPPHLIAVFVGATSGIGATTLREFARLAPRPTVYFLGRSTTAGASLTAECQSLNPDGIFTFIQCDVSLLRNVDAVCQDLRSKCEHINLLWLSQGSLVQGITTEEGLNEAVSIMHFSRFRFLVNLLPLLRQAPGLKRVVSCLAGTKEGPLMCNDFQGWKVPANDVHSARGHIGSIQTLGLEHVAKIAPEVSFIHDFPGFVRSGIGRGPGLKMFTLRLMFVFMAPIVAINTKESGERHVFGLTSEMYPPSSEGKGQQGRKEVGKLYAIGSDGRRGSGVYTVDQHGEGGSDEVVRFLAGLRKEDAVEWAWKQTEDEFLRITGRASI